MAILYGVSASAPDGVLALLRRAMSFAHSRRSCVVGASGSIDACTVVVSCFPLTGVASKTACLEAHICSALGTNCTVIAATSARLRRFGGHSSVP